jgi:hypothetical protein
MPNAIQTKPQSPDWVAEMHRHFQENGFYRPEDLERVFGDQSTGVEVKVAIEIPVSALIGKSSGPAT